MDISNQNDDDDYNAFVCIINAAQSGVSLAALYAGGRAPVGHGSPRHVTSASDGIIYIYINLICIFLIIILET